MNDTGGGVTAIHDVPGDITRIGFHWMLLFFLSVTRRGLLFFSSHGESRKVTDFLCPEFANYRIVSSHGESRNNLFYHELSNYRIIEYLSHGMSRRSRIFLSRIFSLSRIFELSNCFFTRKVAECHGFFLSRDLSLDPLTAGR